MSCRTGLVRELCGQRLERWGRRMGRIGGFVVGCRMRVGIGEGVGCSRRPLWQTVVHTALDKVMGSR